MIDVLSLRTLLQDTTSTLEKSNVKSPLTLLIGVLHSPLNRCISDIQIWKKSSVPQQI